MSAASWVTVCSIALGCAVVLGIGRRCLNKSTSSHPLPPGPPGLPFVGNVIGIDTNAPWVTYAQWAETYGDLMYSRLLGRDMIIINSEAIAKELLDKRSRNYSDRPHIIVNDLCGTSFNTALMPYGDAWRQQRQFLHQAFCSKAVNRFLPYQHRHACQLLRRLFESPDKLADHIFDYTALVILHSVYDYDAESRNDEIVDTAAKVLHTLVPVLRPDVAIIIGTFPALLYLPSWLPGMSFKRQITIAKEATKVYLERPFEYSLQKMPSNRLAPGLVYDALRKVEESRRSVDDTWMDGLKSAAATAFLAGAESSNTALMTFMLMMLVYPEVQERAQAQIEKVVGNDRLPSIEDRQSLPYVDAVIREMHRHSPLVPLSAPHSVTEDDIYAGFYIPKGSYILANVWSMARDETKYPNSHQFMPERFLNEDGSLTPDDTEHIQFGFGRRICPGRHFADTSIWSVLVKFLAVFKILRPLDENGEEVPVELRFKTGVVVHPILPSGFRIVPRTPGMDAEKLEVLISGSAL